MIEYIKIYKYMSQGYSLTFDTWLLYFGDFKIFSKGKGPVVTKFHTKPSGADGMAFFFSNGLHRNAYIW